MKKKELIEQLEKFDDDAEIVLWSWDGNKSTFWFLNPICSNNTKYVEHQHYDQYFGFSVSMCRYHPQ